MPKKKSTRNQITVGEWFVHVKALLEKDDLGDTFIAPDERAEDDDSEFNWPISDV